MSEETVETGTVAWFSPQKGYGFIKRDVEGAIDLFVHYTNIDMEGYKTLEQGTKVEYVIGSNEQGPQAEKVHIVREEAVEEEVQEAPEEAPEETSEKEETE